jgi:hypothetical protein
LALPVARFIQLARVAAEAELKEQKNEMVRAAFIGYQNYLCQGPTKAMSFKKWCDSFGLVDEKELVYDKEKDQQAYEEAVAFSNKYKGSLTQRTLRASRSSSK